MTPDGAKTDMTPSEIETTAAMINLIRPDWSKPGLEGFMKRRYRNRPAVDVQVAFVIVANDPRTESPNLMDKPGPWWEATRPREGAKPTRIPPRFLICAEHGEKEPCTECGDPVPAGAARLAEMRAAIRSGRDRAATDPARKPRQPATSRETPQDGLNHATGPERAP